MPDSYSFMAGYYSVNFDSQALGVTEVGFEMVERPSFNVIRTDATARTPVDGIWTGMEDIIVRFEGLEWSTTLLQKAAPFIFSTSQGIVQKAGQLMTALAKTLILTPLTGPAAIANAGKIFTFGKAYPLEPLRTVFSSQRLRTLPVGFYVFASEVNTNSATMYALS